MKVHFNFLFIILLLSCYNLPASDSSEGFRFNIGDEYHYEIVKLENEEEAVTEKLVEFAVPADSLAGFSCVEYKSYFENDTNSRYCRTDSTGLYFYFDKYINNYSELFPELNNFWLKYIDFQNKEWTQFSFAHDTTYSYDESTKLEIEYSGKFVEETEVKLGDTTYVAKVTRAMLNRKETVYYKGETTVYNSEIALELTYIDGIGLYKTQRIYDGELADSFQVLKNITKK